MISRSCGINFIENVGLLSDEHSVATTEKIPTKCVGEHSVGTTEKIPTKCVDEHSVATTEKIPPNVVGTPENRLDMYVEVFQSSHDNRNLDNHNHDNDSVVGVTEEEEQSMEMVTVNQHAVSGEDTNETEQCSDENKTERTSTNRDNNSVTEVTHGGNIYSDVVGQGDNILTDVGQGDNIFTEVVEHGEVPKCTCGRVVVKKISRAVTPSELEDIEAQISMEYHQLRTQETATATTTPPTTTTTTTKSSPTTTTPRNKHKSCGPNCLHCRVAHICGWVYLIHYEHVFLQVIFWYFDLGRVLAGVNILAKIPYFFSHLFLISCSIF